MNRAHSTAALIVFAAVLSVSVALAYDLTSLSAASRLDQPVPTGHVVGKDNGGLDADAAAGAGTHHAGEDCGICHTPGGKAQKRVFTMSGTLYEDRLGSRPLVGAEVILQDIDGNVLSMTTNEVGNFWTESPIASNPKSVASHGGTTHLLFSYDSGGTLVPTDPADSRSWQYKAWIKNGDQVLSMITVAPVGGATGTTPRMSCGMHHSPTGSTGAAWVARTKSLVDYPTSNASFRKHVQPIMASKCAPCHVPGERITRLVTESDVALTAPTTVDYSAGHDFTSYAGSTVTVGSGATARTIVKDGVAGSVDVEYPDDSALLTAPKVRKPGSFVVHPGGGFWTEDDPDYRVIRQWIVEGAQDN